MSLTVTARSDVGSAATTGTDVLAWLFVVTRSKLLKLLSTDAMFVIVSPVLNAGTLTTKVAVAVPPIGIVPIEYFVENGPLVMVPWLLVLLTNGKSERNELVITTSRAGEDPDKLESVIVNVTFLPSDVGLGVAVIFRSRSFVFRENSEVCPSASSPVAVEVKNVLGDVVPGTAQSNDASPEPLVETSVKPR